MALRRIDRLIVVEGYMDVVALAQAGFPNAVATLGTATGVAHFEKLFRHAPEVVCCFDGDNAGREAAWKALAVALPTLTAGHQLSFMFLPDGEDPDSLVRKEGKARFIERIARCDQRRGVSVSGTGQRSGPEYTGWPGAARGSGVAVHSNHSGWCFARTDYGASCDGCENVCRGAAARCEAVAKPPSPRPSAGRREGDVAVERAVADDSAEAPRVSRETRRSPAGAALVGIEDSLLGRVIRYLADAPDADLASLLGYWAGQAGHQTLVELADQPLVLNDDALGRGIRRRRHAMPAGR